MFLSLHRFPMCNLYSLLFPLPLFPRFSYLSISLLAPQNLLFFSTTCAPSTIPSHSQPVFLPHHNNPQLTPPLSFSHITTIPSSRRLCLSLQYNDPQLTAAKSGLDGSPVVLIQGPPGTGKTSTIMALLSIVMHAIPAGYVERPPPDAAGTGGSSADGTERASSSTSPFSELTALASPWLNIVADQPGEGKGSAQAYACGDDKVGKRP